MHIKVVLLLLGTSVSHTASEEPFFYFSGAGHGTRVLEQAGQTLSLSLGDLFSLFFSLGSWHTAHIQ